MAQFVGDDNPLQTLIPLLSLLNQQRSEANRLQYEKDTNVLQYVLSTPGHTLADSEAGALGRLGLTAKAGDVMTPDTIQTLAMKHFAGLPEEFRNKMLENYSINLSMGTSGARTPTSAELEQKNAETGQEVAANAEGIQKATTDEAYKEILAMTPAMKAEIGESYVLPNNQTAAQLDAADKSGRFRASLTQVATNMLNDPKGAGRGLEAVIRQISGNKLGLVDVAASQMLGSDSALNTLGQLNVAAATGRNIVAEAEVDRAKTFATNSNGVFTVPEILQYGQYQDGLRHGQAPDPQMEASPKYQIYTTSQQLAQQALSAQLSDNASVYGTMFRQFATQIVAHPDMSTQAIDGLEQMFQGMMVDRQMAQLNWGPRDSYLGNNQMLQQYDQIHDYLMNVVPRPNLKPGFLNTLGSAFQAHRPPAILGNGQFGYTLPDTSGTDLPVPPVVSQALKGLGYIGDKH